MTLVKWDRVVPYVGIDKKVVRKEDFVKYLEEQGVTVLKVDEITLKTSKGWTNFWRAEVLGFVEGFASILCRRFRASAFEWGDHTVLGEVSAKLWYEAAKVVHPDLSTEVVEVYLCDSFLDVKIPTDNVKHLKGRATIKGFKFELPLGIEEMRHIISLGNEAVKKVEKLINAYGKDKILSSEVIELLEKIEKKKREEEEKVEIDYESGFVLKLKGGVLTSIPLTSYIEDLVLTGKEEKAIEILQNAPKEVTAEIIRYLEDSSDLLKSMGREEDSSKLREFLAKVKGKSPSG